MQALDDIQRVLEQQRRGTSKYIVPQLWTDYSNRQTGLTQVNPYDFFLERIAAIQKQAAIPPVTASDGQPWSRSAITYNLFVRLATAWDHDGNGQLDLPVNSEGWRETGTFLKSIALLPYIKALGFNTIHLLPITSIGVDGRKGTLGSPYATRDHYRLDEMLMEPALGLGAEVEFRAFVEAAHHLGLRVVIEAVFRTCAKDTDWVAEHPEWFYWIRADLEDRPEQSSDPRLYGRPLFTREEISRIEAQVAARNFGDLPPPPAIYTRMFTAPPSPATLHKDDQGRWIGVLGDGTRVRIPGAFSDWTLDDIQPPWTDITYLKFYDHPDFNYIAYNTIRMFDARLARPEHRSVSLWEKIAHIIPYYQDTFNIDGIMLDMGMSVPDDLKREMVAAARQRNPDFAFWAEHHDPVEVVPESLDAIMGVPMLSTPRRVAEFIQTLSTLEKSIWFMAAPDNHNTPRIAARPGGQEWSSCATAFGAILPCMPWLLTGCELGETAPINPIIVSNKERVHYLPEQLPLFSAGILHWTNQHHILDSTAAALAVRRRHMPLLSRLSPETLQLMRQGSIFACLRQSDDYTYAVLLIVNTDLTAGADASLPCPPHRGAVRDALSGREVPITGDKLIQMTVGPGRCLILEIERL